MSKTAIVIGATGVVGKALVLKLCQSAHIVKVVAITRSAVVFKHDKLVNEIINFNDIEQYSELFVGDLFFSCLGTTLKQVGSIEAQRVVDVDYQYKAAVIASNNKIPHYLLVSSYNANENSSSSYLKMKGDLECSVKALNFKRISIFQPSLLVGNRADTRTGETIGKYLLSAICLLPPLAKFKPIKGSEVANKMVLVSDSLADNKGTTQNDNKTTAVEYYTLDEIRY